jgi:branched-chain amino acid transport system substrate-binding protein
VLASGPAARSRQQGIRRRFKGKYGEIKQYAPYFYDATLAIAEAMKKANSVDPAKFTPELFNVTFKGATGNVAFDAKGDRKDAEMTIFKLTGGKVVPVAIVKGGQTTPFKMADAAPAAPAAPAAAAPKGDAPKSGFGPFPPKDDAKKEEPKKEEKKK